MKRLNVFLLLSLAANVALATLFYQRRNPTTETAPIAPSVEKSAPVVGAPVSIPVPPPTLLSSTASSDQEFIAQLESTGMPAHLIRAVVYNRIRARYRDRFQELRAGLKTDEYWRSVSQAGWAALTPEARAKYRELGRQVEQEVEALLGDHPDALGPQERALYDQMGSRVPPAKVRELLAIQRDYNELMAQVRDQAKGLVLKSDREKLRLLEKELRRDLESALSPQELLEYELRASPTARSLRNRLAYFEPSEAEFRALAQLQLEIDRQFPSSNLSVEESARRRAAVETMQTRIETILPPERYADYQVTIDGMYAQTYSFVRAYDLDAAIAKQIVALKQRTWQQVEQIDTSHASLQQRAVSLRALEQQVDQQLDAWLGSEVLTRYKRTNPGWLNRLRPEPPPGS